MLAKSAKIENELRQVIPEQTRLEFKRKIEEAREATKSVKNHQLLGVKQCNGNDISNCYLENKAIFLIVIFVFSILATFTLLLYLLYWYENTSPLYLMRGISDR